MQHKEDPTALAERLYILTHTLSEAIDADDEPQIDAILRERSAMISQLSSMSWDLSTVRLVQKVQSEETVVLDRLEKMRLRIVEEAEMGRTARKAMNAYGRSAEEQRGKAA